MTGGSGGLPGYGQMIRGTANPSQPSNFAASAAMQAPHQQVGRLDAPGFIDKQTCWTYF